MAASSDRKIEANRRNASKSSGPKSAEGKEKSRRNGWKHGMAAVVVVPEEETAAFDAARAEWAAQIKPENVAEESLVEQMAAADVRMKRCARVAETAMEGDAIEAVRRWEAKRRHRVRRMAQDLKDDPVNVVADLEAIELRLRLADPPLEGSSTAASGSGSRWGRPSLEEATRLLGYAQPTAPTPAGDPAAIRFWTLVLRTGQATIKGGDHFRPDPTVPERWTEAMPLLRGVHRGADRAARRAAGGGVGGGRRPGGRGGGGEGADGRGQGGAGPAPVLSGCPDGPAAGGEAADDAAGPEAGGDRRRLEGRDRCGGPGGVVRRGRGPGQGRGRRGGRGRVVAECRADDATDRSQRDGRSRRGRSPQPERQERVGERIGDASPIHRRSAPSRDSRTVDAPKNGFESGSPSASPTRNPANGAA